MIKTALAALAVSVGVLLSASAAQAADPIEPVTDWSGGYVGFNLGYAFGDADFDAVADGSNPGLGCGALLQCPTSSALAASQSVDLDGFLGGIQAGFNVQSGGVVAGIEADLQLLGVDGSEEGRSGPVPGFAANEYFAINSADLDLLATLRGRVGVLASPDLLLFVTGGLAYGNGDASTEARITGPNALINPYTGGKNISEFGWTAGAGLEWMASANMSIKAEYMYFDLGSVDYNITQVNAANTFFLSNNVDVDLSGHIARIGLNWHF